VKIVLVASNSMNTHGTGRHLTKRNNMRGSKPLFFGLLSLLLYASPSQAQTATVYWNNPDQVIDGFGASDAYLSGLTSTQAAFFFGTSAGDIGLTLLRMEIPDDGSCTSINTACAGLVGDISLALSNSSQVRIWGTPWSPPASMKTNGSTTCTGGSGNGALATGSYAAYATYLANWVQSLTTLESVTPFAISVQNEPDFCPSYDGALWTASQFDTFIKTNLGPTFASDGLTTLIMMPESSNYANFSSYAGTCMTDSSCYNYVGINAWHDYDATWNPPNAASNPYASLGKKYWETEVSDGSGFGPQTCSGGAWCPGIDDAMIWAAIMDDRMAVENANAWHYWWLVTANNDNEGLIYTDGITIAKRAYVMGNYSLFVRPGFYRVDATHVPQSGITVSAYKNSASGALVIIATNQNSSDVSQTFTLSGATASSLTPWITDATRNLVQQSSISVTVGSFTYALPAQSVTSFVGNTAEAVGLPAAPTGLTAKVQ
jgi:glucuronoarabinoxylan endo-1,4-beta-xylanase